MFFVAIIVAVVPLTRHCLSLLFLLSPFVISANRSVSENHADVSMRGD